MNNPKARDRVLKFIDEKNAIDIFRENNPELKRYTWRKRNPLKQARLYFFLLLKILYNLLNNVKLNQVIGLTTLQLAFSLVSLIMNMDNHTGNTITHF